MGRWVFLGYIGAGNVGDDLMAESFLKKLDPAALPEVVFLGRSADRPKFLEGVPVQYARATPKASLRHVVGAKGLVMLGGTNFHDAVSDAEWRPFRRKLMTLAAVFALCRLFGGKVVHLSIGVGPLARPDARRIAAIALKLGSVVVLRDRKSFELCRSLGLRRAHEARDLAFLDLDPPTELPTADRRLLGIAPTTLANLPGVPGEIDAAFWDRACERLRQAAGAGLISKVRVFAFNVSDGLSDDRQLCQDILGRLERLGVEAELVAYDETPEAMQRSMQDCEWFMAFRYHSAIMAGLLQRRLVLVPYHRKVVDLVEQLGLSAADVLDVEQPSIDAVHREIDRLMDRLGEVGRPVIDRAAIAASLDRALALAAEAGVPFSTSSGRGD